VPTTAALEFVPAAAATGAAWAPLFCGDLSGQTGMVRLVPGGTAPAGPTGSASLVLDAATRTLTVRLVVQGLAPRSRHPAHIHDGSCAVQGPTVFALPALQADAQGRAVVNATLSGVTRLGRWYVSVDRGPDMSGDGAAPLSCGDVARGS
jgi:CHRD domain-containing protein